jgi:uncharacterized OB-fold protein
MIERPFNSASYYHFLNEHKLMGARCKDTGSVFLPPRPMNPETYTANMEWVEFSGRGRLAAYSVISIGPSQMIEAGYDRKKPYCAGIVELEEGPKISAQILDVDVCNPGQIQIGMPVEIAFVERGPEDHRQTFLAFRPASA